MSIKISGPIRTWQIGNNPPRHYIDVSTTYGTLRKFAKIEAYNGESGEQRRPIKTWGKYISNEILKGNYTPAPFAGSVVDEKYVTVEKNKATINAEPGSIALTDGCQRNTALESIMNDENLFRQVENLPISLMVMLQPEFRRKDFLNLNAGKPVNATHKMNLKIDTGDVSDPETFKMAKEIANLLQNDDRSHLRNQINMFGDGTAPLSLASIANPHKTEQPASIYGTAMICRTYNKDAQWGANQIIEAWLILSENNDEIVNHGGPLCPPPAGNKKRAANMIVGLGNALAYRQFLLEQDRCTDSDIDAFAKAVNKVFGPIDELPAAVNQRSLLGDFVASFYEDLQDLDLSTGWHDEIPISYGVLFSMASVGREALPKPKKARVPKKKQKNIESTEATDFVESVDVQSIDSDTDPAYAALESGESLENAMSEDFVYRPVLAYDDQDDDDPFA